MHADYVLRPEEYADGSSADVGAGIFCILLRSVLPCEKYSTVGEQAQRYYECSESFVNLIGAAAASYAEYVQLLGQYERTKKTSPVNGCALSVMGTTRSSRQEASLIGPLRVPILGCGERQRIFMSQIGVPVSPKSINFGSKFGLLLRQKIRTNLTSGKAIFGDES
jgi:hypothetical protein